jgi:hypothetical protein
LFQKSRQDWPIADKKGKLKPRREKILGISEGNQKKEKADRV